jgi:uncharacterized protein (TIGR03435 family)
MNHLWQSTVFAVAPIVVCILNAPFIRAQSSADRPKFEVASIKLCSPGEGGRSGAASKKEPPSPDRLDVNCETVAGLIQRAYSGPPPVAVSGGPAWIASDRYRIEAKAEGPQSRATLNGPMLQALLEGRFQLRIHRESKESPVYEMTVAKGGPKLQRAAEGGCLPLHPKTLVARPAGQKPMPCGFFFAKKQDAPGIVTVNTRGMSLSAFAENLGHLLDWPVIDKTGTAGTFDLYAEFVPDESTPALLGRAMFAAPLGVAPEPGPSFIPALQQQLGLKLEPAKGPREFLIIDHIERPSEN